MHENFMTCNRYILAYAKNTILDFYINTRWQSVNGKPESAFIDLAFRD